MILASRTIYVSVTGLVIYWMLYQMSLRE